MMPDGEAVEEVTKALLDVLEVPAERYGPCPVLDGR